MRIELDAGNVLQVQVVTDKGTKIRRRGNDRT